MKTFDTPSNDSRRTGAKLVGGAVALGLLGILAGSALSGRAHPRREDEPSSSPSEAEPATEQSLSAAEERDSSRRKRSTALKLTATAVVLGLVGIVAGAGTWSAFSGTTSDAGNSFVGGTVTITDNDADGSMFTLSNMKPADTDSGCIVVTYTGSLASTVRLYGTTTGTGLDAYLDLKVTRGTISSGSFDSCTNFSADSTDYIGAGAGVVYNGTLQGFADSYAAGLVDPTSGSPESWTTNEAHAYKFQVTLQDSDAAEGLNATQTFTWEARNS